ncbi:MAG: DsrE family protein [Desulforhopalus sp.]
MKFRLFLLLIVIVSTALCFSSGFAEKIPPDNTHALAGVQTPKTIFDVNVGKADKLLLYLTVITKTYNDLVNQGLKPEFVLAFRGAAVRLLTSENWSFEEEDQQSLKKARTLLQELSSKDVRLEVCSVATNLYHVDNNKILPTLNVVGNTFVSLTGYQNKGYALIPIH